MQMISFPCVKNFCEDKGREVNRKELLKISIQTVVLTAYPRFWIIHIYVVAFFNSFSVFCRHS